MIRSIRNRHRWVWILLAFVIAALFAAGLFSRHPEPLNEKIPQAGKVRSDRQFPGG